MPDNKLTEPVGNTNRLNDSEIKKALECCILGDCFSCYYYTDQWRCKDNLMRNALDLINRLQAENENAIVGQIATAKLCESVTAELRTAKVEAYKRCIENAKEELYEWVGADDSIPYTRIKRVLDNLLKEMGVDGKEGET